MTFDFGTIAVAVLVGIAILVGLAYVLLRWIFAMKRQLWNQKAQIKLLTQIAERLGPTDPGEVQTIKEKNDNPSDAAL